MEYFLNALYITAGVVTAWVLFNFLALSLKLLNTKLQDVIEDRKSQLRREYREARDTGYRDQALVLLRENEAIATVVAGLRDCPYSGNTKTRKRRAKLQAELRTLVTDDNVRQGLYELAKS